MYNVAQEYRIKLHREIDGAMQIGYYDEHWKIYLFKSLSNIKPLESFDGQDRILTEAYEEVKQRLCQIN
jgi:hypothetical protein